ITLDPSTAHPQLLLSSDLRSVRWDYKQQDLPNNPERFDEEFCVLGREGFQGGRHCWEVELETVEEVGHDAVWAVGVANESMRKKGKMDLSSYGGVWAVWNHQGKPASTTSRIAPRIPLPRRVLVCLDYPRGLVTFFNATTGNEIFTFPPASFSGMTLR
ncbi:BT1A1 protein, partial [Trogon melanurus]|nr:BT1A1 protein [Trogon melanurus]